MAPTPAGLSLYNSMLTATDERSAGRPPSVRDEIMTQIWQENIPRDEHRLITLDLAFFTFELGADRPATGPAPRELTALLEEGWITATPIVYEDFLPRSAAGIFASNLTSNGVLDENEGGAHRDRAWMSHVIDRPISDPMELYAAERAASLERVAAQLELDSIVLPGNVLR